MLTHTFYFILCRNHNIVFQTFSFVQIFSCFFTISLSFQKIGGLDEAMAASIFLVFSTKIERVFNFFDFLFGFLGFLG